MRSGRVGSRGCCSGAPRRIIMGALVSPPPGPAVSELPPSSASARALVVRAALAAVGLVAATASPGVARQTPDAAPDGPPLVIPRITGPIELDGVVDESAWESLEPLPMTQYQPTFGGPLSEPTEVRVAHAFILAYPVMSASM